MMDATLGRIPHTPPATAAQAAPPAPSLFPGQGNPNPAEQPASPAPHPFQAHPQAQAYAMGMAQKLVAEYQMPGAPQAPNGA